MARIRTIKPDFFKNETIAELPALVRLLFIGLWTQSDREGRLEDRPKRLKAELFPYENFDVNKGLDELHNGGFIYRYKVNVNAYGRVLAPEQPIKEVSYIQIVNFSKHQQPNVKEQQSTIPAPYKHSANITGKEGKGKEGEQEGEGDAHAEFEKIFVEVMGSEIWIQGIAMQQKLEIPFVVEKLEYFLNDLKLKDDFHKGLKEIKSHFINWLKKEKEKNSAKKENENKHDRFTETILNVESILRKPRV